ITKIVPTRDSSEPVRPERLKPLADQAEKLARDKLHPEAIARAMADSSVEVVEARDNNTGATVFVTSNEMQAHPQRYTQLRTVKAVGDTLELDARTAVSLGLARQEAASLEDWLATRGLSGIRFDQPTWVDSLVATLNTSWMSGLLL